MDSRDPHPYSCQCRPCLREYPDRKCNCPIPPGRYMEPWHYPECHNAPAVRENLLKQDGERK